MCGGMGTWGYGNFDSDTAADHLSIVTKRLVDEIAAAFAANDIGPDDYGGWSVPANLELLALIATKKKWTGTVLPVAAALVRWKKQFLAAWENGPEVQGNNPKHLKVVAKTFDAVLALTKKHGR
jgi:hypothetical protein